MDDNPWGVGMFANMEIEEVKSSKFEKTMSNICDIKNRNLKRYVKPGSFISLVLFFVCRILLMKTLMAHILIHLLNLVVPNNKVLMMMHLQRIMKQRCC
jgi:hypothetical protein